MNRLLPAGPAAVRLHNRRLVLNKIEKSGPISRAELAKILQMSEPTISSIVEDLFVRKLIREVGPGVSLGGRKPTLLQFNPEAGFVAAVDITRDGAWAAISDMDGTIKFERKFFWESPKVHPEMIGKLLEEMVKAREKPSEVLRWSGIAVPGATDPTKGIVRYAPAVQWHNVELGGIAEEVSGLRVTVENDVNAAAIAEKTWGNAHGLQDFVYINMDDGIGAGLVLRGEIHRGHKYAAGEIGFAIVNPQWMKNGSLQGPAELGRFERSASIAAMINRGKALGLIHGTDDFDVLVVLAQQGDVKAAEIMEEGIEFMAAEIINIVSMLDPEVVIIGGLAGAPGCVIPKLIQNKIFASSLFRPRILSSALGQNAALLGALSLAANNAREDLLA